jgi:hypothetical protein
MEKKYFFSYGLPFSEIVRNNLNDWIERVNSDLPVLIAIDGGLGQGKTRLAIEIADYINEKLGGGPHIDFKTQYGMGGEEFKKRFRDCIDKNKRVALYDEAGDFTKRGAMTKFNRELVSFFETFRIFKIIVVCVLPLFMILDQGVYNGAIVRGLFHCHGRTPHYGNIKAYDLDSMFYMLSMIQRKKVYNPFKVYNDAVVRPNFHAHDTRGLMNITDMSKELKVTTSCISARLKKMKLTPTMKDGKSKYFEKQIIDRLRAEIWKDGKKITRAGR